MTSTILYIDINGVNNLCTLYINQPSIVLSKGQPSTPLHGHNQEGLNSTISAHKTQSIEQQHETLERKWCVYFILRCNYMIGGKPHVAPHPMRHTTAISTLYYVLYCFYSLW